LYSLGRVFLCFNCSQKKEEVKMEHKHTKRKKKVEILKKKLRYCCFTLKTPKRNTEKKRLTTLKKKDPRKKT